MKKACMILCCLVCVQHAIAAEKTDQTSPALVVPQQAQVHGQQQTEGEQTQSKDSNPAKGKPDAAQVLFEESLRQMMPLNQDQIQRFREWSDDRDRALSPASPSLKSRTVRVTLEPGRPPAVVRCTASIASSLVFHDSTGSPWPITSVTNGSPQAFQILRPELPEGNLLNIIPIQPYGSGNLVVTLSKQDVPLIIRLESDSVRSPKRQADGLVLFQLAHFGPNAEQPLTRDIKDTASSAMLAFLDHTPPKEAVRVRLKPDDGKTQIWKLNDLHYLRTVHALMWPAWTAVVNGAGGIKCFELPVTPRIMLSKNGVIETLSIEGGDKK